MNIVFFGNSQSVFSNCHYATLEKSPCRIVAVVDTPPKARISTNTTTSRLKPFTAMAVAEGIPGFEPNNPDEPAFIRQMKRFEPDLFVAVGYVRLLKEKVLSVPRMMAVNFHASLLPAYRGKHPVFWALRHGEKSAGLTVHVMDPHLDTGDILYQVRVRTRRRDTVTTLYDRIMAKSVGLVGRLVVDARDGRLHSRSQAGDGASYFSSTSEDDFRLDWSMDAETLRRWICTTPGKCFEGDGDDRTYFQDAELVHGLSRGKPGTLLGRTGIWKSVATGGGLIRVRETECL